MLKAAAGRLSSHALFAALNGQRLRANGDARTCSPAGACSLLLTAPPLLFCAGNESADIAKTFSGAFQVGSSCRHCGLSLCADPNGAPWQAANPR